MPTCSDGSEFSSTRIRTPWRTAWRLVGSGGHFRPFWTHCLDLAKVQTQQGRLLFLISSVKPVPKRRSMTVQPVSERRYMTVKQPSWQEITRHRLGKGANLKKLKNLKLNFEFGSEISPPRNYCAEQPNAMSSGKLRGNRLASTTSHEI